MNMEPKKFTKKKSSKKLRVEFSDIEDNQLSFNYLPSEGKINISITDGYGNRTNSIEIGYEDLRSIFKEVENIVFQNTDIIKDENSFPKPNLEG